MCYFAVTLTNFKVKISWWEKKDYKKSKDWKGIAVEHYTKGMILKLIKLFHFSNNVIFRITFHCKMMLEKMQDNVESGYYDQI